MHSRKNDLITAFILQVLERLRCPVAVRRSHGWLKRAKRGSVLFVAGPEGVIYQRGCHR